MRHLLLLDLLPLPTSHHGFANGSNQNISFNISFESISLNMYLCLTECTIGQLKG